MIHNTPVSITGRSQTRMQERTAGRRTAARCHSRRAAAGRCSRPARKRRGRTTVPLPARPGGRGSEQRGRSLPRRSSTPLRPPEPGPSDRRVRRRRLPNWTWSPLMTGWLPCRKVPTGTACWGARLGQDWSISLFNTGVSCLSVLCSWWEKRQQVEAKAVSLVWSRHHKRNLVVRCIKGSSSNSWHVTPMWSHGQRDSRLINSHTFSRKWNT